MTEFRPIFESQNQPLVVKLERRDRSVIVDDELSETSTNPVQNKVITEKLSEQADIIVATASGAIASFPDGTESTAKKLVVGIEPVQDLHGYDHPWPAGGGVNLLPFDEVFEEGWTNTLNGITATYSKGYMRVTGTNTSTGWTNVVSKDSVWASNVKTFGPGSYAMGGDNKLVIACMIDGGSRENKATPFTAETSVAVRGFYIAVGGGQTVDWNIPMMFIRGTVRPISYAPYSNICPITGRTGANVQRTGKNLLNSNKWKNGNNVYLGQEQSGYPVLLKPGTYTISVTSAVAVAIYIKGVVSEQTRLTPGSQTNSVATFTVEKEENYQIWAYASNLTTDGITGYQLELGSTATAHEPYSCETYPITFPSEAGTVYGGTLTVNEDGTGKLVVDTAMVDMGSLVWTYNTTYAFFTSSSVSTRKIGVLNVWSDLFKTMAGSWSGTPEQNAVWGNGSNATVYVQIPPLDNVDNFMSLVDGHQLMYELATPIEYPLTDFEVIELFKGTNNVWADSGNTSVTYRADTKLYIDNKITQAIANALNSRT